MHRLPGLAYHPSESLAAPRWGEYIRRDRKTNPRLMSRAELCERSANGYLSAHEELERRARPDYHVPPVALMSNGLLLEHVDGGSRDAFDELDRRTRPRRDTPATGGRKR